MSGSGGDAAQSGSIDFHHAHLFASDLDAAIAWWSRHMGAKVFHDGPIAGARNVFLAIGSGRIHLYDQPPRGARSGAVHHLGLRVRGLRDVWRRLATEGIASPHGLRELDGWRYVMVAAPDDVLLELFEFDDPAAAVNRPLPL